MSENVYYIDFKRSGGGIQNAPVERTVEESSFSPLKLSGTKRVSFDEQVDDYSASKKNYSVFFPE